MVQISQSGISTTGNETSLDAGYW